MAVTVMLMALALITWGRGVHGKSINSMIGPWIAYGERFYMCEPDDRPLPWRWFMRATHFNPYKPKELQRLTGNITVTNTTFDDSCSGDISVALRSNNQWKENAFVGRFKKNGCQALKENIPGFYNMFKEKEVKGMCKFPTGLYEANNAPANWTFPNFPIAPYGQYRFKIMVHKAGTLLTCLVVDARVIPKLG